MNGSSRVEKTSTRPAFTAMTLNSYRCLMLAVFVFLIKADDMLNAKDSDDSFLREKEARTSQLKTPAALSRGLNSKDCSAIHQEKEKLYQVQLKLYEIIKDLIRSRTSNPVHHKCTKRGGAVYTRWGKTTCPFGSELVYAGWVGGSHYTHAGGASNPLCLPRDPIYANYTSKLDINSGLIYGTKYESGNRLPNFHNNQEDVPCVVCRSSTRTSSIMLPGRIECYPGWNREYFGYIMAGWYNRNAGSQYICVDHKPESVLGSRKNVWEFVLYFVESRCGSLKCPPYKNGYEVTCAVCTK